MILILGKRKGSGRMTVHLLMALIIIVCEYIVKVGTAVMLFKSIKTQNLCGSIGYSGLLIALIINDLMT